MISKHPDRQIFADDRGYTMTYGYRVAQINWQDLTVEIVGSTPFEAARIDGLGDRGCRICLIPCSTQFSCLIVVFGTGCAVRRHCF